MLFARSALSDFASQPKQHSCPAARAAPRFLDRDSTRFRWAPWLTGSCVL